MRATRPKTFNGDVLIVPENRIYVPYAPSTHWPAPFTGALSVRNRRLFTPHAKCEPVEFTETKNGTTNSGENRIKPRWNRTIFPYRRKRALNAGSHRDRLVFPRNFCATAPNCGRRKRRRRIETNARIPMRVPNGPASAVVSEGPRASTVSGSPPDRWTAVVVPTNVGEKAREKRGGADITRSNEIQIFFSRPVCSADARNKHGRRKSYSITYFTSRARNPSDK